MLRGAEFATLLEREIGLDASSVGPSVIDRAVRERLAACALDDLDSYWRQVCASGDELQALIDAVVVPETWFFRDGEAFAGLARFAVEDWLPRHPEGVLRLLSLPCASGEEPYSMAMALIDAGFPVDRCAIDGVDVSAAALGRARRALYGKNSFRGDNLGFRERHFESAAGGERPGDAVRRSVSLRQGNLLAADFLVGAASYDAIFCRNLLIYFDRPTQERAVAVLARLIAADGVLFVGPAEVGALQGSEFVAAKAARAFALRGSAAAPAKSVVEQVKPAARHLSPEHVGRAALRPPSRHGPAAASGPPSGEAGGGLDEASRLADQGRLDAAAKSCERYLQTHPPSAQAHHLLGLIRAAAGDLAGAVAHYRKALYLDHNHRDTLLHYALLLDQQGDSSGAQRLQQRSRRLAPNGGPR